MPTLFHDVAPLLRMRSPWRGLALHSPTLQSLQDDLSHTTEGEVRSAKWTQ